MLVALSRRAYGDLLDRDSWAFARMGACCDVVHSSGGWAEMETRHPDCGFQVLEMKLLPEALGQHAGRTILQTCMIIGQ